MIYLDNNATTRPLPAVVAAVTDALSLNWANPSSTHPAGQAARQLLADARGVVGRLFGAQPAEVLFTSSATEANALALLAALAVPGAPRRLVVSAIEHAGLLQLAAAREGVELVRLPVDARGVVVADALPAVLAGGAALVSVMAANNETGVIQPVAELARLAAAAGVPMHVDATQLAGRLPVDFAALGVRFMSASAHKLHGPKGVGVLLVKKGAPFAPALPGHQERGRRGGTENLPGIAGFAAAARHALAAPAGELAQIAALRDALERGLATVLPLRVFGAAAPRLPNTSCVAFGTLDAEVVLQRLARAGICASSGSACSAGGTEASHVLRAMGVDEASARAAVRFSLSADTTPAEIAKVIDTLQAALTPLLADALAA
ncbi:MAG: cysteine desulfurase family protein [Zoogloea sp.]|uniref:cysteine desulfurase family protein n=1 Tax=Zoogloea sp. TaxID=49181 RepID=UPI00260D00F0|nr:cysteine desulfurase family protein [Zoogloea sp.]MDD3327582.1 cysteine desulfurase family protein [Zoogloea sp.]